MTSALMDFIHEAGWPIFPVMACGLGALTLSLGFAHHPTKSMGALIRNLCAATLLLGVLGTVLGLKHSFSYIGELPLEKYGIFIKALDESINNVVAALVLVVPALLLHGAGQVRQLRAPEAPAD